MSQQSPCKPRAVTTVPGFAAYPFRPPTKLRTAWSWKVMAKLAKGRKSLGTMTGTRDEVRRHLFGLAAEAETGTGPGTLVTVGDLASYWLGHCRDRMAGHGKRLAASSFNRYEEAMAALVGPVYDLRGVALLDVTTVFLKTTATRVLKAGETPSNVDYRIRRLITAWNWARSMDLVPERPLVPPPWAGSKRATPATPTEPVLLEALAILRRSFRAPWVYRMVFVQAYTGLRVGEMADLTWANVDLDRKVLRVQQDGERSKTGGRDVYFDDSVKAVLVQCFELFSGRRGDHVFPTRYGAMLKAMSRTGLLGQVCEGMGLRSDELFSSHGLRRFSVRRLRRAGVDVTTNAAHHGHSIGVMLKIYDEALPEDKQSAVAMAAVKTQEAIDKRAEAATPEGLRLVKG